MRPIPLLAAAAIALAMPASAQTPVQTVVMYSYGYSPSVLRLRAGRPVTLHFVNRAGSTHDFTARSFFAASRIVAGHVDDGEVHLRGRRSASVTLIPAAGRYKVHCGQFFHKPLGMKGWIVVQ